jgi:hypothetical protein
MAVMDSHADRGALTEFALGNLQGQERAGIEQHVGDCVECRSLLIDEIQPAAAAVLAARSEQKLYGREEIRAAYEKRRPFWSRLKRWRRPEPALFEAFVVTGRRYFPVERLAKEQIFPLSSGDARNIVLSLDIEQPYMIGLGRYAREPLREADWARCGWKVHRLERE